MEEESLESDLVARRFFSPEDNAWLKSLPGAARRAAFYRLWTLKEAILKADGRGLEGGLERVRVELPAQGQESGALRIAGWLGEQEYTCWSFPAGPGARAALAAPGEGAAWDGQIRDFLSGDFV
jgi:phosphopantetheinyl transferase